MIRWVVLTLVVASGCVQGRAYVPLTVALNAEPDVRAEALRELALDMDWRYRPLDPRHMAIEATSPRRGSTRDRIVLDARRDALAVSIWTEMLTDRGQWQRTDEVCDRYEHAREREIAARYVRIVRRRLWMP